MTTLITDTGPIIALAKIKKLSLLEKLELQGILIPPRVQKELWGKIGDESDLIESALDTFIQVKKPEEPNNDIENATASLDEGEREVIFLGAEIDEKRLLLLDDKAGRRIANNLQLPIIGTAGLLLLLKQQGLVEEVFPLMTELRQRGYWLSDALVFQVQQLAGE
jgi:hypothetical protein